MEDRPAQVTPEGHRDPRAEVDGSDGRDDLDEADGEHPPTRAEDVAGVPAGHALVDDVGVEARQIERRDRPHELQDEDERQLTAVGGQVGANDPQQHQGAFLERGPWVGPELRMPAARPRAAGCAMTPLRTMSTMVSGVSRLPSVIPRWLPENVSRRR